MQPDLTGLCDSSFFVTHKKTLTIKIKWLTKFGRYHIL